MGGQHTAGQSPPCDCIRQTGRIEPQWIDDRARCERRRGELVQIRWRLRHVAADREIWTGAELRRLLAKEAGLEIGASAISDLMTKQPSEVKIRTLAALCTALNCTPNDLFELTKEGREEETGPEVR